MQKQFRTSTAAFTLIELLIVVAIIAILAAIAVPNFLEAQVRSKVSRTRADMRSIATAVEAYAVDWNKYPTYHYLPPPPGGISWEFFLGGQVNLNSPNTIDPTFTGNPQITSPVAYITTVPRDVFFVTGAGTVEPERSQFLWVNWPYVAERVASFNPATVLRQYGTWRLTSAGPDLSRGQRLDDAFATNYDPTNGTVSTGQIHRTALSPEGLVQP